MFEASETRFREVPEIIETGDNCRTMEMTVVPAVACVGRKMRPENVGWVLTNKPHTSESLKAFEARRSNFVEEGER